MKGRALRVVSTPLAILVIDDDMEVLTSLEAQLNAAGHRVLLAHGVSAGLRACEREEPHIVLMALRLQSGDSRELLQSLCQLRPQTPVIVSCEAEDVREAIEARHDGAWDLLLRPIEEKALIDVLQKAAERRETLVANAIRQLTLQQEVEARDSELHETNAELRALNARLQQLLTLIGGFSPSGDYEQLTAQLLTHFVLDLSASGGRFYEVEATGIRLVHVIESESEPEFLSLPLPRLALLSRCVKGHKPLMLTTSQEADESLGSWGEPGSGSVMAFPFVGEGNEVIAIIVLRRLGGVPFRGQDLKIGGLMTSFCGGVLRSARTTVELRRSEQRYRDLVQNARSILVRLDPQGRVRFYNEYSQRFFGFPEKDVLGKRLVGTIIAATEENTRQFDELLHSLNSRPETHSAAEQACRQRNGATVWIAWTYRALVDAEKKVTGVLCVGTDITARKQAEEALEDERDRLQSFMDTSPIAIMVIDRQGRMIQANTEAKKLLDDLQAPVETLNWQAPGASWTDWDGTPLKADQMPLHRILQVRRRITDIRLALARPQGRRALLSANCAPIFDERDRIVGMIAALQDVSQQLALEDRLRQSQKMETVGQLAGGVAHDFNNLLLPILGFSEMVMGEMQAGDPFYERVSLIYKAGERAKNLTRQLLAFSRKQVFEIELLDLNEVVGNFQKMLRRTVRENIEMQVSLRENLGRMRGDASQLEQVLMNLVINAQHAMPESGTLIIETDHVVLDDAYAQAHPEVEAGPYVVMSVTDTGIGMDKETLRHIFEPFFTTKKEGEGTGLGLASVYGIVRQHNGSIWVYSEVGRGTTFKLYFPRQAGTRQEAAQEPLDTALLRGTETIALAEDDDFVRQAAVSILTQSGYQVIASDDPARCLQLVENHDGPVHLLLSDVIMPMWNGRELYHRLLRLQPELRVVFMSGYTEKAIAHYGVLDKGVHFIQKPFNSTALLQIIRAALDAPEALPRQFDAATS